MAAASRLRRVVEVLGRYGVQKILELEKRDPQYEAVCQVVKRHGEIGARLAMLNALVSYRLAGKGEEHWRYFGAYFSSREVGDICRDFLKYIDESPYLKLAASAKKTRALKTCRYTPNLNDLRQTLHELSRLLDADPHQKTLVFTIKILNYAYICASGADRTLPMDIPIPVDYRVAHLTWCAGLIDTPPSQAAKNYREVQQIWNKVAEETGIPPLHIDTVLWLAGRAVLYGENIHQIPEEIIAIFRQRDCRPLSKRRQAFS